MNVATVCGHWKLFSGMRSGILLAAFAWLLTAASAQDASSKGPDTPAKSQDGSAKTQDAAGRPQSAKPDNAQNEEVEAPAATLSTTATPEERIREAWMILEGAAGDTKHAATRIQALAALGMLRSPRSEKTITDAMADADVDVRTAAVLAAGETKDRNMTTSLRNLLDDKEPQVAFAAAMTLWKMNDKSGEDILMSIVDGGRSTNPTMMHGTEHKISKDLHDPAKLAKLGATQGAFLLLGPFGYGITAFQFMHQGGGDFARASAIEQIAQEHTEPIHKELVAALGEKDPVVRAAAAKALVEYRDKATSMALYALFADPKYAVRLTSAAAYLRTTGVPGPPLAAIAASARTAKGSR
ncbi:MAG TPA: HEAT repeat domain-containing protein [Acidobacteriaceae bacterium]